MKYLKLFAILALMQCLTANPTTQLLMERMETHNTMVCVGLDPDLSKFPDEIALSSLKDEEKALTFLKEVVDLTHIHTCCYKAQKAFFDVFENGHSLLRDTIAYIKSVDASIPVIIDCKIGDTENTMKAYIHLLFDKYKADAIVVNPYMGDAVLEPFVNNVNLTGVVLIQTSNPSAKVVQELELKDGSLLWEKMFSLMSLRWNQNKNLIPVISSNTLNYDYAQLRAQIPQQMPILLAGIGLQGGDLSVLKTLLNDRGVGVFVGSSRGILYPYAKEDSLWRKAVTREVITLKERINEIRFN